MQSVTSRIWTRVAVSISYDDNHYTTGIYMCVNAPVYMYLCVCMCMMILYKIKLRGYMI